MKGVDNRVKSGSLDNRWFLPIKYHRLVKQKGGSRKTKSLATRHLGNLPINHPSAKNIIS